MTRIGVVFMFWELFSFNNCREAMTIMNLDLFFFLTLPSIAYFFNLLVSEFRILGRKHVLLSLQFLDFSKCHPGMWQCRESEPHINTHLSSCSWHPSPYFLAPRFVPTIGFSCHRYFYPNLHIQALSTFLIQQLTTP